MNEELATLAACGGCCTSCAKKANAVCPGCIEADGYVPEWAESGRCRIHACTRAHGVTFCGMCIEFPCANIEKMIHWNPDIIPHMYALLDQHRASLRKSGE